MMFGDDDEEDMNEDEDGDVLFIMKIYTFNKSLIFRIPCLPVALADVVPVWQPLYYTCGRESVRRAAPRCSYRDPASGCGTLARRGGQSRECGRKLQM